MSTRPPLDRPVAVIDPRDPDTALIYRRDPRHTVPGQITGTPVAIADMEVHAPGGTIVADLRRLAPRQIDSWPRLDINGPAGSVRVYDRARGGWQTVGWLDLPPPVGTLERSGHGRVRPGDYASADVYLAIARRGGARITHLPDFLAAERARQATGPERARAEADEPAGRRRRERRQSPEARPDDRRPSGPRLGL